MKLPLILGMVVSVGFLPGCSAPPEDDYQLAIEFNYSEASNSFLTANVLDSGDTVRTRQMLMVPVFLNLDSVRPYSIKGLVELTPEKMREWTDLARDTLDYMLLHRDAWDSSRLDVRGGIRGLRYWLTDPADVQRLNELLEYFDEVQESISETHAP